MTSAIVRLIALILILSGCLDHRSYQMGELLFWIVLAGLPVLLVCGFAYAHYLKKTGGTTSEEDGA